MGTSIGSEIESQRNTRVWRDCLPDSGGLCLKGCGSCVTSPERPIKVRSSDVSPSPFPADGFTRHPDLSARRHGPSYPPSGAPRNSRSGYFFSSPRIWLMTAVTCSGVSALLAEACFGLLARNLMMSSSDIFLTSSDTRLLAAPFPAPSGPWHTAHFALYSAAPSSAAQDRLGIKMNRATAIGRIREEATPDVRAPHAATAARSTGARRDPRAARACPAP